MNHSVIKLSNECLDIDCLAFSCGTGAELLRVEKHLRENYSFENVTNRVMLIGTLRRTLEYGYTFDLFNDRDLSPLKVLCYVDKRDKLTLVKGHLEGDEIFVDKCEYLESGVLHFGNIKSDIGFKLLVNSVITEIDLSNCDIYGNFIDDGTFRYLVSDDLDFKGRTKVRVLGRMSDFRGDFNIQILKILD